MKFVTIMFLALSIPLVSMAQDASTDGFFRRFKIVRDESGKVVAIKDRMIPKAFSINPFLEQIVRDVKIHLSRLSQKDGEYQDQIEELLSQVNTEASKAITDSDEEDVSSYMRESLYNLSETDIDGALKHPVVRDILAKYEFKLAEYMRSFSLRTVARLDSPRFFYQRAVTYKAVEFGLNMAKKKLTSVPLLGTVSYILVRVDKLLRDRRLFNQNILLHYFENFAPEDLNMTKEEVDLAVSSIYESRISYLGLAESNRAELDWFKYGFTKFYQNYRLANNRLRKFNYIYQNVGKRLNFAFIDVVENGQREIINLVDKNHMFSSKPHVAYYYDRPNKVFLNRTLIRLSQIGLSFVPFVPERVRNAIDSFADSFYYQQKITEGSLYGYFDSIGDDKMKEQIKIQSINPYDNL